jgi:hypothetical protein
MHIIFTTHKVEAPKTVRIRSLALENIFLALKLIFQEIQENLKLIVLELYFLDIGRISYKF